MKLLSIETATEVCAVALAENGKILSEISREEKHIHAEQLVPMIQRILSETRTELAELDGVAVSIGPGSFTGLRIGLSVAKGLAFASNLPLVALSTLKALAYNVWKTIPVTTSAIVSVIEIQRDEFATAKFSSNDFYETHSETAMTLFTKDSLQNVEEFFKKESEHFLLCGHNAEKFFQMFSLHHFHNVHLSKHAMNKCSASSIALLGEQELLQNEIADIASLEPFYGKDFITKKSTLFERIVQ